MGGAPAAANMQMPKGHPSVSASAAPQGVDLSNIQKAENGLTIAEIYASETVARLAPALQKAAAEFASRQVRNVSQKPGQHPLASQISYRDILNLPDAFSALQFIECLLVYLI